MLSIILIPIPSFWNVTLIEVIWTLAGLLTVLFSLTRLPELWRDWVRAVEDGRRTLRISAGGYLRREAVRVLMGLNTLALGVYASLSPPLVPGPQKITVTGLVLTLALLLIAFETLFMSSRDWHDRVLIEDAVNADLNHRNP